MHSNEILTSFSIAAALGVCLFKVAHYLRTSAIVVLLIGGVVAGPEGLGLVNPEALGDGLGTIISLAVAIILFEGGLTLDLPGYRTVSREILGILTIGVLVTWTSTALILRLLFGFDIPFCVLAASLVIVTGPTVIGPLLHRIRVESKLHHILHWEGVLIDPIGVFLAILSFEFYISTDGGHQLIIQHFLTRFAVGAVFGVLFGVMLDFVLRRQWIDKGHTNIFVLAMAMLNFALADMLAGESGLLSVTIAGLVLGSRSNPQLRHVVSYKVELKDFLIGLLFVLLAANLKLQAFLDFGWQLLVAVLGIMLIVRPLNIFVSLFTSPLTVQEKTFLSWIAPRGIVAASMASIFALDLTARGVEEAVFLESFTYSVIAGTVIVQGFSAGAVGRWLGVLRPVPRGWIIVGAHPLGRQIAKYLKSRGIAVVLVDTNARETRAAERMDLIAINENAMHLKPNSYESIYECGNLLALTANPDLNRMLCQRWSEFIDGTMHRWERAGYENLEDQHLLIGDRIWETLPLDRWMHADSDAPPLQVIDQQDKLTAKPEHVMFSVYGDTVRTGVSTKQNLEADQWLVFAPSIGKPTGGIPLSANNVIFSEQTELSNLYKEMLQHLHSQLPLIDPEELFDEMWKHEEEYTSLLGHGIALPHARTDAVKHSILMTARPREAIRCPQTGKTIEIVLMLLSPAEQHSQHLNHLSSIARMIGTESQRQRILAASEPEELFLMISGE